MRNLIAIGVTLGLFSVLPAAAAPCPGNPVFQDSFTAANPALDVTEHTSSKITIQGGKAEVAILTPGMSRMSEYAGTQYVDVNVCITASTPATDKAVNQSAGIIFWATDNDNFYCFEIAVTGQFAVTQQIKGVIGCIHFPGRRAPLSSKAWGRRTRCA